MFIKNDREVAFDEVNRLLRLSGDQYRDAAARMDDPALVEWLMQQATRRLALSEQLEQLIRQTGELPARPDPDQELVKNVLAGIKEAFSRNHVAYELEQRDLLEIELAGAIEVARHYHPAPDMEQFLVELASHVHEVREQIGSRMPT